MIVNVIIECPVISHGGLITEHFPLLICSPKHHLLIRFFSAHNALTLAAGLAVERNTARRGFGILLDLRLTGGVAAPPRECPSARNGFLEFIIILGIVNVRV